MTEEETEHTTVGEIAGNEVTVTVKGPEQQVLDESGDSVGSDIVSQCINMELHSLKEELEENNQDN